MLDVITESSGGQTFLRCRGRLVAAEDAWHLYNTVISQKNDQLSYLI